MWSRPMSLSCEREDVGIKFEAVECVKIANISKFDSIGAKRNEQRI
jgi:hypothetical protein